MMKGNFFRYYLFMMIAILASSACYAQTNQGYSKKKTVTTKTVSRSRSSKKQKSGSHQSHSSSKQSGNQNYDVPIFNMDEILKKIESQDYIVFLSRTGVVYGFNKNTHKYFSIMKEVADIGFKDSSNNLLSILTNNNIRYFYNLLSGKTEKEAIGKKLSDLSYHAEFKRQVDALHQIVLSYYNGNPKHLSKEEADACISRYNYCYKIITDFESAFDYYYGSNSCGLTVSEAKNRLINAKNAGHEDAVRIYNKLF